MAPQEPHQPSAPVTPTAKEILASRKQAWDEQFEGLARFASHAEAMGKIEAPVYDLNKSR